MSRTDVSTKSALSPASPVLIVLAIGMAAMCVLFVVILSKTTSSAATTNTPPAFAGADDVDDNKAMVALAETSTQQPDMANPPGPANPSGQANPAGQANATDHHSTAEPLVSWEGMAIWPASADVVMVRKPGETKLTRIRLAGLDVPVKSTRNVKGQEPWGTQAHQFVVLQVTRQRVRVEIDPISPLVNRYSPIGYIWIGDELLNEQMLAKGHAFLRSDVTRLRYTDRLQQAQEVARRKQVGVWDPSHPFPMKASDTAHDVTPDVISEVTHASITP